MLSVEELAQRVQEERHGKGWQGRTEAGNTRTTENAQCKKCFHRPCICPRDFSASPSCLLEAACISGNCLSAIPPKAKDEIVIFRKRYTCCMEDNIQNCSGTSPYVRTVRYVVRPHWEQLVVGEECPESWLSFLDTLTTTPLPDGSSMARCLQCAYSTSYLEEQSGDPCSESSEEKAGAMNEFERIRALRLIAQERAHKNGV